MPFKDLFLILLYPGLYPKTHPKLCILSFWLTSFIEHLIYLNLLRLFELFKFIMII